MCLQQLLLPLFKSTSVTFPSFHSFSKNVVSHPVPMLYRRLPCLLYLNSEASHFLTCRLLYLQGFCGSLVVQNLLRVLHKSSQLYLMLFFILLLNRLTSLLCCLPLLESAGFHMTVLVNARNGGGQMGVGRVAGESEEKREASPGR